MGDGSKDPSAPAEAAGEPGQASGSRQAKTTKQKAAEARQVAELAQRDRQVRAHEAAHQAVAGGLGGAASFTFETGPDGRSYAVGGEVPVDMSPGRTPEETIRRAQQVRAAALAPVDPSPQDLAVAAAASVMEAAGQQQLMQEELAARNAPKRAEVAAALQSTAPDPDIRLPGEATGGAASMDPRHDSPSVAAAASVLPDVTDRAASTTAALEASRRVGGITVARLQQAARLATLAYAGAYRG